MRKIGIKKAISLISSIRPAPESAQWKRSKRSSGTMPKTRTDLSDRITTPWTAYALGVCGGLWFGLASSFPGRVAGVLLGAVGGLLLAIRTWTHRATMAQVLAVIPVEDKGDAL